MGSVVNPDTLLLTYYPSCIVDLRIRFDENMTLSKDSFPRLSQEELVNQPTVGPPYVGAPHVVAYSSTTDATQLLARVPVKASVEIPSYRSAGTWDLTFNYSDLPIDPRTVRSLSVSIYMDTVQAVDFGDKIGGTRLVDSNKVGEAAVMRRNSRTSMLNPSPDNLVMRGIADNWSVSHTSSGSMVNISGRDLRAIFLDSPISTAVLKQMPIDKNIKEIVEWLVSKHPYGKQMTVAAVADSEWPNGRIPSPYTDDGITNVGTRVTRGAKGGKKAGAIVESQPEVLNFWDIIVKYCYLVGAVPYFQAEKLVLKPARNLYDQQSAGVGNNPTPFKDGKTRNLKDNTTLKMRRLMYGRNIEELNIERKLGGRTTQQVELHSLDTSSKERGKQKLLIARWPPDNKFNPPKLSGAAATAHANKMRAAAQDLPASLVSGVSPTDSAGKQDVLVIPAPGISSITRLTQMAQDVYEEISRGELGGSVQTKALASFGGDNEDPDLVRLRPGDAIELMVDARNLRTSSIAGAPLSVFSGMDDATFVQKLTELTNDANLARVVAASSRNAILGLQSVFRVSNVSFDWDVSSGISLAFDFHNFVVARSAVTPTPTEQGPLPASTTAVATQGK